MQPHITEPALETPFDTAASQDDDLPGMDAQDTGAEAEDQPTPEDPDDDLGEAYDATD